MGTGSWDSVSIAYHPVKHYCDHTCTFLASAPRAQEVIAALAEYRSMAEIIDRVRIEIAAADASRSFLSSLISRLRGSCAPDIGAVQLASEQFLLRKRCEWHSDFGSLIQTVDTRAQAQMHGHYPFDKPLASYEEISRWMALWGELHRTHPPDGPVFRKVSWAQEWSRFKTAWLSLEPHLRSIENADEIPQQQRDTVAAPVASRATTNTAPIAPLAVDIDRGLRAIFPENLAIQVKTAFLHSHFFDNCERDEIIALLDQISEWNRELQSKSRQSSHSDRSELHGIARDLIAPYNGALFVSESELATIQSALEPNALWLKQRELTHILTAVYARRLLRLTPRELSLRSAAPKVQTPVFTEPADLSAPAYSDASIEHRLTRLADAYQQLYPGMQLVYKGNCGHSDEFLVYQPLNHVVTSADDLSKNRAFMGDPAKEIEGLLPRSLRKLLDGNNSDSPSTIVVHHSNIHPTVVAEPIPAPDFDLDTFLAGLGAVYERALQSGSYLLSDGEDVVPSLRALRPTYYNISTPLTDVPSLRLSRDSAGGLFARSELGFFTIRNGQPIAELEQQPSGDADWEIVPAEVQLSSDECFGVQRLVLDHCDRLFIPAESDRTLSHGTVVVHINGLAGTDELREMRLQLMAETVARFDRHTAVVLQGSEENIECFRRHHLSIPNPYTTRAPIFTDSIGVPNLQRAVHLATLDDAASISYLHSNRVISFENLGSELTNENVTIPLYAPRFFVAQSESRVRES